MIKPPINIKAYIEGLRRQYTELDMNEDPEIVKDASKIERLRYAQRWLESRVRQLESAEESATRALRNAEGAGCEVPHNSDLECRTLFEEIKKQAQTKYDQAILQDSGLPITL